MRRLIAALVLLVALPLLGQGSAQKLDQSAVRLDGQAGGANPLTGATILGDTTANPDVVPNPLSISAQSAYPQAGTNTTGANLNLAGGLGRRFFTIVSNTALATKTITLTANGTAVTLTASAGAPAANQFGPVGTDDTAPQILVTSTALAAAVTAHATLGPLMTPSVAAGVVYLTKTPTLNSLAIATGTAGALVTAGSGADGGIAIPTGEQTAPVLALIGTPGLGLYFPSTTNLGFVVNGVEQGRIGVASYTIWGSAASLFLHDTTISRSYAGTAKTSVGAGTATANIGGTYAKFVSGTGVGNGADTTDDALWTLTPIPANTFTADGDALVLTVWLNTAANGNVKQCGITVGGTQINLIGQSPNNLDIAMTVMISRVDATHVTVTLGGVSHALSWGVWATTSGKNLAVADLTTNTLAVVVTGASPTIGAANDIMLLSGVAEFKK